MKKKDYQFLTKALSAFIVFLLLLNFTSIREGTSNAWESFTGAFKSETADEETDEGETNDGETEDEETDDGETNGGETDDGETNDGETNDGETEDEETSTSTESLVAEGVFGPNAIYDGSDGTNHFVYIGASSFFFEDESWDFTILSEDGTVLVENEVSLEDGFIGGLFTIEGENGEQIEFILLYEDGVYDNYVIDSGFVSFEEGGNGQETLNFDVTVEEGETLLLNPAFAEDATILHESENSTTDLSENTITLEADATSSEVTLTNAEYYNGADVVINITVNEPTE